MNELYFFLAKMMTKSSPSGSLLRLSAFPGLSIISYAIHTHIFFQSMSPYVMLELLALIQYSYSHTITYVATYYIIQKSHSKPKNNYEEYVTGMMMESNANVQYAI